MQKESGASRWWLWVTVWFYDDIKDIIEICRVAAYLNNCIQPTPGICGGFLHIFWRRRLMHDVGIK